MASIQIKKVRIAFAVINEPKQFRPGEGTPRYSASFIVEPDSENYKKIVKAMKEVAIEQWHNKGEDKFRQLAKTNKLCFIEGDLKPDIEGYPGNFVLNTSAPASRPPVLLYSKDGKNHVVKEQATQDIIYSGCYVVAKVSFWAQDNNWGQRINCRLEAVQYAGPGDRFGGATTVRPEDMEVLDVEPENLGATSDVFADDDEGDDVF